MATWTSGEPVSPFTVAYSVMSSCLRGAVIDIVLFLSDLAETRRLEPGCRPAEAIESQRNSAALAAL
jgi:hypothetical protein